MSVGIKRQIKWLKNHSGIRLLTQRPSPIPPRQSAPCSETPSPLPLQCCLAQLPGPGAMSGRHCKGHPRPHPPGTQTGVSDPARKAKEAPVRPHRRSMTPTPSRSPRGCGSLRTQGRGVERVTLSEPRAIFNLTLCAFTAYFQHWYLSIWAFSLLQIFPKHISTLKSPT